MEVLERTPKVVELIPFHAIEDLIQRAGITPFDFQKRYLHERWPQMKLVSGGVGASKSLLTALEDLIEVTICGLIRKANGQSSMDGYNGRLAIVGPTYKPTRVVFLYLLNLLRTLGEIDGRPQMHEDRAWRMVTTSGVEIVTFSAQDPQKFAALPYTRVHMTEAMQIPKEFLDFAMERVARWPRSPLGTICLEGTFEAKNTQDWYIDLAEDLSVPGNPDGRFYCIESWLNTENFPGGFNGEKVQRLLRWHKRKKTEHIFWTRFGGHVPQRKGALWHGFFHPEIHLGSYDRATQEFDPAWMPHLKVDFTFDPGLHRYGGLFIQRPAPDVVHIIDELVTVNKSSTEYMRLWRESPYVRYHEGHGSPWNIGTVVSDIAGQIHSQGNKSTWEHWTTSALKGGCGVIPIGEYLDVEDGVTILQHGFSGESYQIKISPRCIELLSDLRKEKRDEFGEVNEKKNKGNDDLRKALSYYLCHVFGRGLTLRQSVPSNQCIGENGTDYQPGYFNPYAGERTYTGVFG